MQRTGLSRKFAGVRGKLAAAGLAALVAFGSVSGIAPQAQAQDAGAQPAGWTEELRELDRASSAASKYAQDNYGDAVAILLRVGQGLRDKAKEHGMSVDDAVQVVGDKYVKYIKEEAAKQRVPGVMASYFPSQNDTQASGIVYIIGNTVYASPEGEEVLDLKEARVNVPDLVENLVATRALRPAADDQLSVLQRNLD